MKKYLLFLLLAGGGIILSCNEYDVEDGVRRVLSVTVA